MINLTKGAARDRMERDEALRLLEAKTLILDDRRRRPFYFDGRFLTARDLTREQEYFLARQADFGRTVGAGVVAGLTVSNPSASSLLIQPGHGITPAGEMVALTAPLRADLLDIPETLKLDAAFGLSQVPAQAARTRNGVFVLALRPVEFTANPIAQYPRTLTEPRSAQDGEIIEAAAATLIPFPDDGLREERAGRRAVIAKQIFGGQFAGALPANALPLAMVALTAGVVQWLDMHLVRREVGADHGDLLGLGFAPRALREAHFQQYMAHLADVLAERRRSNRGERFAATEHFDILPPAGPFPAAAFNMADRTQVYFPPSIKVEVTVLPEDELPPLIDESMLLPPLDLSMSVAEQEATEVLIVAPLSRERIAEILALGEPPDDAAPPIPALISGRKPLQSLLRFQLDRGLMGLTRKPTVVEARWRQAIASAPQLWYARKRNFPFKQAAIVAAAPVIANDRDEERELLGLMRNAGLEQRFLDRKQNMTARGFAAMVETLSEPKFTTSPALLAASLKMFEESAGDQPSSREVAQRLSDPKLGEGVARLEAADPAIGKLLADASGITEIDRAARREKDDRMAHLAGELSAAMARGGAAAKDIAIRRLEDLER